MADQLKLSLLKEGAKAWNEWRHKGLLHLVDPNKVDLSNATLTGADLSWADLSNANLSGADLISANLSWANLSGADLSWVNLDHANLTGANLSGADLSWVNLDHANLTGANLSRTNLSWAKLFSVLLDGVSFERATVGITLFGSVDLSSCSGLDSVEHSAPSTLGVDSIIRSRGRIPENFLRGVGLPDEWIDYIPSLVGDGIQFFSCFISYSSLDKPFAVRLHDALQGKGIRCWLDEKQLWPGHDISRELERGIYLWDKFLLCASKNSLTSAWVEEEIETTLEKERKLRKERGKKVFTLIPLNLDDFMLSEKWDFGTHAREIRPRVAADFQGWETNKQNFDIQVDRVIKALRADEGAREKPPPAKL